MDEQVPTATKLLVERLWKLHCCQPEEHIFGWADMTAVEREFLLRLWDGHTKYNAIVVYEILRTVNKGSYEIRHANRLSAVGKN
jgi:hypothetical protein